MIACRGYSCTIKLIAVIRDNKRFPFAIISFHSRGREGPCGLEKSDGSKSKHVCQNSLGILAKLKGDKIQRQPRDRAITARFRSVFFFTFASSSGGQDISAKSDSDFHDHFLFFFCCILPSYSLWKECSRYCAFCARLSMDNSCRTRLIIMAHRGAGKLISFPDCHAHTVHGPSLSSLVRSTASEFVNIHDRGGGGNNAYLTTLK